MTSRSASIIGFWPQVAHTNFCADRSSYFRSHGSVFYSPQFSCHFLLPFKKEVHFIASQDSRLSPNRNYPFPWLVIHSQTPSAPFSFSHFMPLIVMVFIYLTEIYLGGSSSSSVELEVEVLEDLWVQFIFEDFRRLIPWVNLKYFKSSLYCLVLEVRILQGVVLCEGFRMWDRFKIKSLVFFLTDSICSLKVLAEDPGDIISNSGNNPSSLINKIKGVGYLITF